MWTKASFIAAVLLCAVLGASCRGYFLLGRPVAVLFAIGAATAAYVVKRVFLSKERVHAVYKVFGALLTLTVVVFLFDPTLFNRDFGYLIAGHQSERATQSHLRSILHAESRFSSVSFECHWRKCVILTVRGRIPSEQDVLELRQRIFEQCPDVSSRWLFWEILCVDSGVFRDGCDLETYGDVSASGAGI